MANEILTYKSAFDELTKINNSIMSNDIDVDSLSEKVKRAMYLVDFCNGKLKTVREEIDSLLNID
jgi:exodeoxyribonuclease VII small subunit